MKRDVSGIRIPKFHIYDPVTQFSMFLYTQDFVAAELEVVKIAHTMYNDLTYKMSYESPIDQEGIIVAFWGENGYGPSYTIKEIA